MRCSVNANLYASLFGNSVRRGPGCIAWIRALQDQCPTNFSKMHQAIKAPTHKAAADPEIPSLVVTISPPALPVPEAVSLARAEAELAALEWPAVDGRSEVVS
jgi:hypothetical protein